MSEFDWIIIASGELFLLVILLWLIFFKARHFFWVGLKYTFGKSRDWSWRLMFYSSGGARVDFEPNNPSVNFGTKDEQDRSYFHQSYNHELGTGAPVRVFVQGQPANINIHEKYEPSINSLHVESLTERQWQLGLAEGFNNSFAKKIPFWVLIVAFIGIAILGFVAYQSWQTSEAVKGLGGSIAGQLGSIREVITQQGGSGTGISTNPNSVITGGGG